MGRYLKLWMQANHIKQQEVCDTLDIPESTLSNYLKGKPMGTKHMLKLSRFTGISCRHLIENHDRDGDVIENNEPWHDEE